MITCTQCGSKTTQATTNMWDSRHGQIIGKDEKLCPECRRNREAFAKLPKQFKGRMVDRVVK